jgi:hypothetical protein
MARRLIASGQEILAKGGQLVRIASGNAGPTAAPVTFTQNMHGQQVYNAAITLIGNAHSHYEIGDWSAIGITNGPAGGSLWLLTSSTPPGAHIWPDGYKQITLTTPNQATTNNTGTMQTTSTGKSVYIAENLLYWIPAAAFAGASPLATTNTTWDADF